MIIVNFMRLVIKHEMFFVYSSENHSDIVQITENSRLVEGSFNITIFISMHIT